MKKEGQAIIDALQGGKDTEIARRPLSIKELFRSKIPAQPRYDGRDVRTLYQIIAADNLYPYLESTKKGQIMTIAGPALTGTELQHILHYAAPSKAFGLDYEDRHSDWNELYDDPKNATLLAKHRKIPYWKEFERYREFIDTVIENSKNGDDRSEPDIVVPVIRLGETADGIKWDFSRLSPKETDWLTTIYQRLSESNFHFLPILGPTLAAAYSPDITQTWGEDLNFRLDLRGYTQDMGATQAMPLTLAKADSLLEGLFMQRLLTYTKTGILLPPDPKDDTRFINIPPRDTSPDADTQPITSFTHNGIIFYPENPSLPKKNK